MAPLKHIAFITGNYPSTAHPNRGTFVRQLVHAIARQGVRCSVIYPWKIHEWLRHGRRDSCDRGRGVEGITVHRPLMLSLSNRRMGPLNTFALTQAGFQQAVWRVLSRLPEKPDVVYGHFLYSAGAAAIWAATRLARPGFVAVGESIAPESRGLWTLRHVRKESARRRFAQATGFVAVSDFLRRQLVAELSISEKKVGVFPNGIDVSIFYPRDRLAMRRKQGLPADRLLVAFVGAFDERKGVQRVCEALKGSPQIGGIFIGDGPLPPRGEQVLFSRRVAHEEVPELLCAADVFVLPSREEGCSNATLEAMACGLPVVISARPFNDEICDKESACLIEPDDIGAIRNAIIELEKNPGRRRRLADAALARATRFDIETRARGIIRWMNERTDSNEALTPELVDDTSAIIAAQSAAGQISRVVR